jgi:hypothetical protein
MAPGGSGVRAHEDCPPWNWPVDAGVWNRLVVSAVGCIARTGGVGSIGAGAVLTVLAVLTVPSAATAAGAAGLVAEDHP